MQSAGEQTPFAWQPFTPRGVAAFGRAAFGRVLLVQLVVALLTASSVVWFVQLRWFSVISAAIEKLPLQGEIRSGKLNFRDDQPQVLAENRFLAIIMDPKHQGNARSPAHIQVEFGNTDVKVLSLFGSWQRVYPRGWVIPLNRPELKPWWGAWAPALLALVGGAVLAGLMLSWAGFASVYCWAAWLVAFFNNRFLTLAGSWRLASAALMPGALFMLVGGLLYGFGLLDLIQVTAVTVIHFAVGWFYLLYSPLSLPLLPALAELKTNPFVAPVPHTPPPQTKSPTGLSS
jgi:hypothetical protein